MYVGVDLVKAERWERICEKFPSRLEKMFTEEERAHCEAKGDRKSTRLNSSHNRESRMPSSA